MAGITAAVLAGDLLTGTTLQLNSLMGYTAVVGARYYGLANIPFALLATRCAAGHRGRPPSVRRPGGGGGAGGGAGGGRDAARRLPGIGSDFGGVIAFVPGIAVTALLVAGKRVSMVKLARSAGGRGDRDGVRGLNYLRPPAKQTHLGRFVGQVINGEALDVIFRKLGAMLTRCSAPT